MAIIWLLMGTCSVVKWGENHVYAREHNGALIGKFETPVECLKEAKIIQAIGEGCEAFCIAASK